jgi:hypothetical protein
MPRAFSPFLEEKPWERHGNVRLRYTHCPETNGLSFLILGEKKFIFIYYQYSCMAWKMFPYNGEISVFSEATPV